MEVLSPRLLRIFKGHIWEIAESYDSSWTFQSFFFLLLWSKRLYILCLQLFYSGLWCHSWWDNLVFFRLIYCWGIQAPQTVGETSAPLSVTDDVWPKIPWILIPLAALLLDPLLMIILPEKSGLVSVYRLTKKEENGQLCNEAVAALFVKLAKYSNAWINNSFIFFPGIQTVKVWEFNLDSLY